MAEERNINQKDVQDVMSTLESSLHEIGDEQKDDVVNIFSDIENVKILCKKDLSHRDRMVFIYRNIDE